MILIGTSPFSDTMVLQCLMWIPHFWDMLICTMTTHNNGFFRPLPREIIIDILSRLPADCVLKCRRVSKEWLALTSTLHTLNHRIGAPIPLTSRRTTC